MRLSREINFKNCAEKRPDISKNMALGQCNDSKLSPVISTKTTRKHVLSDMRDKWRLV